MANNISVCILVKDEGPLLKRCLNSVQDKVGEILVIDNGSTDNTSEIAKEFDCRLVHLNESAIKEGEKRNVYLELASNPWIMVLDADETLDSESINNITKATSEAPSNLMGFRIPRYEYIGKGKWACVDIFRLMRKHPKIRYNISDIHCTPTQSIRNMGGEMGKIFESKIHHFYILLKKRTSVKRKKYLQLLEQEVAKKPNAGQLAYLGLEYLAIGDQVNASRCYNKAIELDFNNLSKARLYLAQLHLLKGSLIEAQRELEKIFIEGISLLYDRAHTCLAELHIRNKNLTKAKEHLIEALKIDKHGAHNHINYAAVVEKDDPELSIFHIEQAIKTNPYLLEFEIYGEGEKPNVFEYQSSFLSVTKDIFTQLIYSYRRLGNQDKVKYWENYKRNILPNNFIGE